MPTPVDVHVPVQARSQRTRAALASAAQAEFSMRGYAQTTAKGIAERAGTGTGTFYRYFKDKDAVLQEITSNRVRSLRARVEPLGLLPTDGEQRATLPGVARARIRKLVDLYVAYHRADRRLHAVITERRLCDAVIDEIMTRSERQAVEEIEHTLVAWGYDGDATGAAFMWFSLLEGAVHAHVLSQPVLSDARFSDSLTEALLRIGSPRQMRD